VRWKHNEEKLISSEENFTVSRQKLMFWKHSEEKLINSEDKFISNFFSLTSRKKQTGYR